MAITVGTLVAGFLVAFCLPATVITLNIRRKNAGWLFLLGIVVLLISGNLVERVLRGSSPMF